MALALTGVNKKYRRLATAIITLVILAVVQPFLWGFVHRQALELQQRRSQGQQITNAGERNAEISLRLKTAREFLSQLEVVSPPTTAKTQVVERLEQLADQLGLQLEITQIQDVPATKVLAKDDPLIPVSVSVKLTGSSQQLLQFLDRVEHTQELSVVPSWNFMAPPAPPASIVPVPAQEYTLTLDIYFFLRDVSHDQE